MKVYVNGRETVLNQPVSLAQLMQQLDCESHVAAAVNGEFVGANKRPEYQLKQGDQVELLSPIQGG